MCWLDSYCSARRSRRRSLFRSYSGCCWLFRAWRQSFWRSASAPDGFCASKEMCAVQLAPECRGISIILKSAGFSHDAKRNPCMLVVSWRLAMNFAREPFFAEPRRKSGSMWRRALATTNSDGGMPGRMVRSHDPNESPNQLGRDDGEILEQALDNDAGL